MDKPKALIDDCESADDVYGKCLRSMLMAYLVKEKMEQEEKQIDVQMAQLLDRFQKITEKFYKTSRRLKEIGFVVEQKRLADLKYQECNKFYTMTENSGIEENIINLMATEEEHLSNLETVNVDFGYNKKTGHKQLLDTVNDAVEVLEGIKKNCNLDSNIFNEYKMLQTHLDAYENNKLDIESLKGQFDIEFPKYCEKLFKDVSDKITAFVKKDV